MSKRTERLLIISVLLIALLLRVVFLSRGDVFTDEVAYAFRAIGMLDYVASTDQTTPLEWFDPNIPWWTKLSFHDHPPLVFLLQNISMHIFSVSSWAFRLPSVILGALSVFLLYAIGRRMFGFHAGLAAAFLLAVNTNHVYISRMGLQESTVIFFILLAWYAFLAGVERPRFFLLMGAALGFGFLAKYNAAVAGFVIIAFALLWRREVFRERQFWFGLIIAGMLMIPVFLYNIMLYRTVGHFDFQFSYIFGQHPDVWKITPGKDIGTLMERVRQFLPRMLDSYSWVFLALVVHAFFVTMFSIFRRRGEFCKRQCFIYTAIISLILLLLVIGPSYRFLAMLAPVLVLFIVGANMDFFSKPLLSLAYAFFILILLVEGVFAYQSHVALIPYGQPYITYAPGVRKEIYNHGYRELDVYFKQELRALAPETLIPLRYDFLSRLQTTAVRRAIAEGKTPASVAVIYDNNIQGLAKLWVFGRRMVYDGWPMFEIEQYLNFLKTNNTRDFFDSGFRAYYVVFPSENVLLRSAERQTTTGSEVEEALRRNNITSMVIRNGAGVEAFRVYKYEK